MRSDNGIIDDGLFIIMSEPRSPLYLLREVLGRLFGGSDILGLPRVLV